MLWSTWANIWDVSWRIESPEQPISMFLRQLCLSSDLCIDSPTFHLSNSGPWSRGGTLYFYSPTQYCSNPPHQYTIATHSEAKGPGKADYQYNRISSLAEHGSYRMNCRFPRGHKPHFYHCQFYWQRLVRWSPKTKKSRARFMLPGFSKLSLRGLVSWNTSNNFES